VIQKIKSDAELLKKAESKIGKDDWEEKASQAVKRICTVAKEKKQAPSGKMEKVYLLGTNGVE